MIGTELAGYRIEDVLGRGGMGTVYLALHMQLGRKDALKVLSPEVAEDEAFRRRFITESRLAAGLEHPNIIPIYHAGEAESVLFIAMKYAAGGTVKDLLRKQGLLPPETVLAIGRQIAAALDAAHAKGLVHRDVKPANILLDESGQHAYLADFGIAKSSTMTGVTKTGALLGTVDYCAPEQIEGRPVDARTDVYALGCVLYQCLSGSTPFPKDTEIAVIQAHLQDPPPALSNVRPGLASGLDGVLVTAMAKFPEVRYRSCRELVDAFATAIAAPTLPGAAPSVPAAQRTLTDAPPTVPPAGRPVPGGTVPYPVHHPPPLPAAPGRSRLSGRVLAVIAGVLLLAGIGAAAAVLLARGGSKTNGNPPPPPSGATHQAFLSAATRLLRPVVSQQQVVDSQIGALSSTAGPFARLRDAGRELDQQVLLAEGASSNLTTSSAGDRHAAKLLRQALAAHAAYAVQIEELPAPTAFGKAYADAVMRSAAQASGRYEALDAALPDVPSVPLSATTQSPLLAVAVTTTPSSETVNLAALFRGPLPNDGGQGRCFGPYPSATGSSYLEVGGVKHEQNFVSCGDFSRGNPLLANGRYTFYSTSLPTGTNLLRFTAWAAVDESSDSNQAGSSASWQVFYGSTAVCSASTTWPGGTSSPQRLDCALPAGAVDTGQISIVQRVNLVSGGGFWAGLYDLKVTAGP